ncbi:DUF4265 domain-containing protein [Halioxenophilus sp. WMMB6]|uniref:DUF4265 domain-containing protein n=1 Tax=Halioxenophilus sp. WMMB6 TaxID=3073815 RepID=UPI00295E2932|nr:DUF4265 domain-containing protein [Halioxenophilus sp. WMMB6]
MQSLQVIEMFAGTRPDGQAVVERLRVTVNPDNSAQLALAPAFVQGLARGDTIAKDPDTDEFTLVRRSGNLCIRVYSREHIDAISLELTPALEKLGGELDVESERMLVYSIHVSCGFSAIEALLNQAIAPFSESTWLYGNVYDPADGVTPLNWWQEFLSPE